MLEARVQLVSTLCWKILLARLKMFLSELKVSQCELVFVVDGLLARAGRNDEDAELGHVDSLGSHLRLTSAQVLGLSKIALLWLRPGP